MTGAAAPPGEPGERLDRARLEVLAALDSADNPDFRQQLVRAFEESTARHLLQLRAALARADTGGVLLATHALKGSASNLGASRLAAAARHMEHRARHEAALPLGDELEELAAERDWVLAAIRREWAVP